ncbi:hypothetical protein F5148DRAFT_178985 [Russula earlei]|uniref:Uncharacterized protein n=1 Tax=Russula earlei TaxID=71964 RepID=A0ACC0UJJ8_9AGAM|nr:hypothetical protein F5148DRAFT_178985 [Russula earlei]
MSYSSSPSPPRKRRRMSSPTYDDQLAFPGRDELEAIDKLELSLSQASSLFRKGTSIVLATGTSSQDCFGLEISHRVSDSTDLSVSVPCHASSPRQHAPPPRSHDIDDPFSSTSRSPTRLLSASVSNDQHTNITLRPSDLESGQGEDDISVEQERDTIPSNIGFTSASGLVTSSMGFTSASALPSKSATVPRDASYSPPPFGALDENAQSDTPIARVFDTTGNKLFSTFTSFGKQKNIFQPSAAAMRTALERAQRWAAEDSDLYVDLPGDHPETTADGSILPRKAQAAVESVSFQGTRIDATASESASEGPLASGRTNVAYDIVGPPNLVRDVAGETFRSAAYLSNPTALESHPRQTSSALGIEGTPSLKPFKSPMPNPSATRNSGNPQHTSSLFNTVASTPTRVPKPGVPDSSFSSAVTASSLRFSTPMHIRGTPIRNGPMKKFVTPFKPGMRPGEAGHKQLKARYDGDRDNITSGSRTEITSSINSGPRKPTRRRFFDLSTMRGRMTLASSGFQPGKHGPEVLTNLGINVAELHDINPKSALQHRFHVLPQGISYTDSVSRGPTDALWELKELGCHMATQEWVDNHWSLILWKLAGMVALNPESEADNDRKRWSWAETMRQLRYRYEKELNCGARPALRLIAAQDASAGLHMVFCVSDITWSGSGTGDDGLPLVPHPTLELTDGWYRLRAQADDVLARAARRGIIRVGRKIAVCGASLPRNAEPCEVLEAYDKVKLNITGNGSHLAPWYTKLGFQPRPAIATLHALSPEGGVVPCLQLVVTKVYPIAFIEFRKDVDGNVMREGPRREKEELAAQDAWSQKREHEYRRLRKEAEDKQKLLLEWAHRFQLKSGGDWHPRDDEDMPEHIESMFDDCEYASDPSSVLRRASKAEAGWLARFAQERAEQEREAVDLGLERELQSTCPPREVRSFRVLLTHDACTTRRPARRVAELTVWDVLSLGFDGTPAGHFKEGQRFQVTNLLPTQKNAWMDRGVEGAHVYLSTSKTSRWIKL